MSQHPPKIANQEKAEEREAWFKIALKVIRWIEGGNKNASLTPVEPLTNKEWVEYCQKMLSISGTHGKLKTQEMLRERERIIKLHGGFSN
jgi:hypothetical protein